MNKRAKGRHRERLARLEGYNPAAHCHETLSVKEITTCLCQRPARRIAYVKFGADFQRTMQPLIMCEECYQEFLRVETPPATLRHVPSKAQVRYPWTCAL